MSRWTLALCAVWFGTCVSISSRAQESGILSAYGAGKLTGKSLLALPSEDAASVPGSQNGADDLLFGLNKLRERDITDRAYPLMAAKWPFNTVFVCWEESDPAFAAERGLVRAAIHDSWEMNSALKFLGWSTCNPGAEGIRIHVEDSGPHVKLLGKFISGVKNGMVLNFTYKNWSPVCQTMLEFCDRAIAVHEFGHAIGFAHEQNRPDTPGECTKPAQGSNGDTLDLTPWDAHSVMNYCNPVYSNGGILSPFDVIAVQYIYGAAK